MKIKLTKPNPALLSIIENPEQIITLDANFLIAPDRRMGLDLNNLGISG